MEFGLFSSRLLTMDRTFLDSGVSSSGRLDWNKQTKKTKKQKSFFNKFLSHSTHDAKHVAVSDSDHVCLQVGEGRQAEEVLDEVGWRPLAQPQEHGVSVLQQERARVAQTLL